MNDALAKNALSILAEVRLTMKKNLKSTIVQKRVICCNDENDSKSPIMDRLNNAEDEYAILQKTSFSFREFQRIFAWFTEYIFSKWNVRRGKRSTYKSRDILFLISNMLKHGGQRDFLTSIF